MPVHPSAPRCSLYCCSSPRSYTKRAPFPMIPFQRSLSVSDPHVYPFFLFYQTFRTRFRQTDSPIPVIFIRHIRLPKSYRKLCSGPAYYQTIRNFDRTQPRGVALKVFLLSILVFECVRDPSLSIDILNAGLSTKVDWYYFLSLSIRLQQSSWRTLNS